MRSKGGKIVVEVVPLGDHDDGCDPMFMAAPLQPMGGALAFRVVVPGNHEPRYAGRRSEGAEASGRERGSGDGVRKSRHQGEHGLDALADKKRAGEGFTEMDGTAVHVPERLARAHCWTGWAGMIALGGKPSAGRKLSRRFCRNCKIVFVLKCRDGRFGGQKRVEPGAVDAGDIAVDADYGGDKGRQAANAGAVPVEQSGVEAERRKTTMVDRPSPEIGLGVGAVYGTATPPKAARCLCTVVGSGVIGGEDWRHGEEDAGLGKGGAKRAQAGGDADQVEKISVLAGGAVGPLAGNARRREADEERAPLGAANVAGGPVSAFRLRTQP